MKIPPQIPEDKYRSNNTLLYADVEINSMQMASMMTRQMPQTMRMIDDHEEVALEEGLSLKH